MRSTGPVWLQQNLRCWSFISFCFSNFYVKEGVVITRRPTSARSITPALMLLWSLQCAGETGAPSGPRFIAFIFTRLSRDLLVLVIYNSLSLSVS